MQIFLDLILPRHCLLCGTVSGSSNLCRPCLLALPYCRSPGGVSLAECDRVISALHYRRPVDYLVCRFKFSGDLASGQVLGQCLAECLGRFLVEAAGASGLPQALVPVPLHGRRQFWRSFNQADVIARQLGSLLGIPVWGRALVRKRNTEAQSRLDASARRDNIRGAFQPGYATARLRHQHVVLIDDVMTTGATLSECARTLAAHGARRVDAWTVARAEEPAGNRESGFRTRRR